MTQSELITRVRQELGKLKGNIDIEDTDIIHESGHVLTQFNTKMPKKVLRSVVVQAGQSNYTVNAATLRVQEIFSNDDIEEMRIRLGSYIVSEAAASEDYNFPSLWVIKQQRRRWALPRVWFEFNPIERLLKINPTPRISDVNYWYTSLESPNFTLVTLPEDFDELVHTGTTYRCMEIVAMRRSTEGGIIREGGRIAYPADALFKISRDMKKEYEEELDLKVKLYTI